MNERIIDVALLAMERTEKEYFQKGLDEAKRRLSLMGLHDARCPEPDKPCNCGIDEAIDTYFPPGALPFPGAPVRGDVN